jgi:hypothetical protein
MAVQSEASKDDDLFLPETGYFGQICCQKGKFQGI